METIGHAYIPEELLLFYPAARGGLRGHTLDNSKKGVAEDPAANLDDQSVCRSGGAVNRAVRSDILCVFVWQGG